MSHSMEKDVSMNSGSSDAEATLRMIARLPAPRGLESRIHTRLGAAPRKAAVLAWPVGRSTAWMRSAAAAAIVCVVAGGGWGIYSRVQPDGFAREVSQQPAGAQFSTGEARRRPQTLAGPEVKLAVPAKPVEAAAKLSAKASATKPRGANAKAASKASAEPDGPRVQ